MSLHTWIFALFGAQEAHSERRFRPSGPCFVHAHFQVISGSYCELTIPSKVLSYVQRVALEAHTEPAEARRRNVFRLEDGGGQEEVATNVDDAMAEDAEEETNA